MPQSRHFQSFEETRHIISNLTRIKSQRDSTLFRICNTVTLSYNIPFKIKLNKQRLITGITILLYDFMIMINIMIPYESIKSKESV